MDEHADHPVFCAAERMMFAWNRTRIVMTGSGFVVGWSRLFLRRLGLSRARVSPPGMSGGTGLSLTAFAAPVAISPRRSFRGEPAALPPEERRPTRSAGLGIDNDLGVPAASIGLTVCCAFAAR